MMVTLKYKLRPSRAQHARLAELLDQERKLYNAALEERISAWRRGVSISQNDQTKSLTEIRRCDPKYGEVPYNLSKWTLYRLDDAMKGFFRRAKVGKGKAGFPRFRPASRWNSFGFSQIGGLRLKDGALLFKSLSGRLRLRQHRPLPTGATAWTGLDLPDECLDTLVLTRLPYPRPTIVSDGKKGAYGAEKIAQMAMTFKQGIGRLVRVRNARPKKLWVLDGRIALLDNARGATQVSGANSRAVRRERR